MSGPDSSGYESMDFYPYSGNEEARIPVPETGFYQSRHGAG